MFEREMSVRFDKMIGNAGESVREKLRLTEAAFDFWIRELSREREEMSNKIYEIGVVWSEEEKDLFFSQLKESLFSQLKETRRFLFFIKTVELVYIIKENKT